MTASVTKQSGDRTSLRVIILLGILSLFSDVVYEGARGIAGPYLASLGATGAIIGFIAGLSEMLGYAIRLVAGKLSSDRSVIWPSIWVGYLMNLLSIPGLALATTWPAGAALMFAERLGKGIRSPARDVVLTEAAGENKRGFAFGLHTTLDQIGAVVGPLIVAAVLFFTHNYRTAFTWLLIPAALALMCIALARMEVRKEPQTAPEHVDGERLPRTFWVYAAAIGLLGAGFIDYPLIAYNLEKQIHLSGSLIAAMYSLAMATEAILAIPLGKLFDKAGFTSLRLLAWMCVPMSAAVFASSVPLILLGLVLWGVGIVFQQTLAKAAISLIVPPSLRSTAFGAFGLIYGVAWFIGSSLIGWLYDQHLGLAMASSVCLETAGALLLLQAHPMSTSIR